MHHSTIPTQTKHNEVSVMEQRKEMQIYPVTQTCNHDDFIAMTMTGNNASNGITGKSSVVFHRG